MSTRASEALAGLLALLLPARDVLVGRVDDDTAPAWCEARGWTAFLLSLDDDELRACEEHGFAVHPRAPEDLRALAASLRRALAPFAWRAEDVPAGAMDRDDARGVRARKAKQLPPMLASMAEMAAAAARIVDVGAGSGHLTRLAARRFDRDALGIDRDPARVAAASRRAGGEDVRFAVMDARKAPLTFAPGDLALGLHACGDLGDRLVLAAAEAGADVALVGCCPQKIEADRRAPLSRAGEGLVLGRDVLGLANLSSVRRGVEVTLAETLDGREARLALRLLLASRGVAVAPGEEMRGINRRQARGGLARIAPRALATRDLAPAAEGELERHEVEARRRHAAARRLSLPRNMLARPLELAIALDRASALEERGYSVEVRALFDPEVTPRNLGILATRRGDRPAA